jgi:predicted Zn-dependent peptidase
MKKWLITLAMLVLLMQPVLAQKNKIKYEQYTLKNGLRVLLHQDNSTPIVAVSLLYHVGSKDEDPQRTGFAHFFEHLLFEGSENIGRGEYMGLVKDNGGTLNANTSYDRTFYYEILPSNQLELALWMESERLLHAKIEDVGIETQREVVKEERRQRFDNTPYGSLVDETMKRVFKTHPYGRGVIGSMDHLNAAKRDEFYAFYKKYYIPNNAVLSIAGDINVKQTKKWIEKYFGDIPKGPAIERPDFVEPKQTAEIRDTVYDNIQLPAVVHAYRFPAQGTSDYYAMDMLSSLLSKGNSSRFQRNIVDRDQKALFVGAFPLGLEDESVALMFGIVNMGIGPDELDAAMVAEVEKVKKELISEEEFQKLKNQFENDLVSSYSSMAGIAENLANYLVYYGDANLINTEIARYNKVTREDIKRVAQLYLNAENRVSLHYLPKNAQ